MNKKKVMNKKNIMSKKNIIICLVIFLILGICFILLSKNNDKNVDDNTFDDENKEEIITLTDEEAMNYLNKYQIFDTKEDILLTQSYLRDTFEIQDFTKKSRLALAIASSEKERIPLFEDITQEITKEEKVKEKYKELFGTTSAYVKYTSSFVDGCTSYSYDNENAGYLISNICPVNFSNKSFKVHFIKKEKTSEQIIIILEYVYIYNNVIYNYKDIIDENKIGELDDTNEVDFSNYDNLHRYKFIFNKNGDDYILTKQLRMK